jgi:hypothetical protein
MKRTFNKVLFFSITFIAFYSCNTMGKIGIQVSVPSKYPISPDIQSIAILNRSVTPEFTDYNRDSLESMLVKHDLALDTVLLDSVAADTAIQVAAKAIYDSQRFDVVVPKERNIIRKNKGGMENPLDKTFINDICNNFNVNAVLVLENFSERVSTDFSTRRYNVGYQTGRYVKVYDGVINLSYKLTWRLYQPQLNPSVSRFDASDTVFWDSSDYSLKLMYNKLPSIKEALIGGAIASGDDITDDICPKWQDETRTYFITGNKVIDAAIPLIKENKWEEAAEIWMKYSTASPNSLRSKVEYNLALAAEMNGDIDLAIEWGIKSYKTKYSREADLYLKYLDLRRASLQKASRNL